MMHQGLLEPRPDGRHSPHGGIKLRDEDKIEAARRLSYLIPEARVYVDCFVSKRVDPKLSAWIHKQGHSPALIRVTGFAMILSVVVIPYAVARTMMGSECDPYTAMVNNEKAVIQREGCEDAKILRERFSGIVTGIILLFLFFVYHATQAIIVCLEKQFRIGLLYYASWPQKQVTELLLPYLDAMRFESTKILGEVDSLDAVATIVVLLVGEFVWLALDSRSLSALAVIPILLRGVVGTANVVFGVSGATREVMLDKLRRWGGELEGSVRGLPFRMHEQVGNTFSVNIHELLSSHRLIVHEDAAKLQYAAERIKRGGDRSSQLRFLARHQQVSVCAPQYIFITTARQMIDVWSGTIENLGDLEKQ